MTAPTTTAEAQDYLAAVEAALLDLPDEERAELLEDLAGHLADLGAEPDDRPLAVRLGAPAAYADELRAAAGLPSRATGPARWARLRRTGRAGADSRVVREVRAFLPQLRPAWWVLRGYLLVLLPCLREVTGQRDFPVPAPAGSHPLGVVLVLVAVLLSVALGRRRLPTTLVAVVVLADLVLVGAAVQVARTAQDRLSTRAVRYYEQPLRFDQYPTVTVHGPVTDVFPYAADGTPLEGVLLYDQDGRPLEVGKQLWWPDGCRRVLAQPRAADGTTIPFSYPQVRVLDPEGLTLGGAPVTAGQCAPTTKRPTIVPPKPLAPPKR